MEEDERARRERERGAGGGEGGQGEGRESHRLNGGNMGDWGEGGGGETTSRERYGRVSQREAREGESERGTGG